MKNFHSTQLVNMIYRFIDYVKFKDKSDFPISFQDKNTFLGREENYKSKVAVDAQTALQYEKWTEDWISNRKILECAGKAINCSENLVNQYQRIFFLNKINPEHKDYRPEAAKVLFNIYKSRGNATEESAFSEAKKIFGGSYDLIAYLFFIKDSSRFLPISSGNFEKSLASVGIDYKLRGQCNWENYNGFIRIVRNILNVMKDILPEIEIRLIDAHSFLWVIRYPDFIKWNSELNN